MPVKTALCFFIFLIATAFVGPLPIGNPVAHGLKTPTIVVPTVDVTTGAFICSYTGGEMNPGVVCSPKTVSNGHAERVVDRILRPIGLVRNFKVIECTNTDNCFATVMQGQRFIVYDGAFMQKIEEQTETDWSAISIMAHEIGHHLQGHTIDGQGGQPQKEIEADKFSGFVLHQLGASLAESLVAVRALGNEHATRTHPAKPARIDAIRKGWLEAEAMYPKNPASGKPTVAVTPTPIPASAARPRAETTVMRPPVVLKAPANIEATGPPAKPATTRVGCVSGNCQDGRGVFVYPTRERYVGEFEAGDRHGQGADYYADGRLKYKGFFRHNLRTSYGVYVYRNGDTYAGLFSQNMPNGKGTYTFADGSRLAGLFKNGQPVGEKQE